MQKERNHDFTRIFGFKSLMDFFRKIVHEKNEIEQEIKLFLYLCIHFMINIGDPGTSAST